MSNRYKGGIISATPPTLVAGAGASGAWTLEQQMQATAAGLWPQNGPFYIEDVFSTWLYTGTGATQTITNGIDLAGKGGLVWIKNRNTAIYDHNLFDTARGTNKTLRSDTTGGQLTTTDTLTAFGSTGFTLGSDSSGYGVNDGTSNTYVSWTFREQPKFFDVVTWTGNGANYRAISHSLGSTPGMVIVKSTSASGAWAVWHRSVDPNNLILNSTSAAISGQYSIQDVGSTSFAVANSSFYGFPQSIPVNDNGATYVAYLFAHNAGGFGLTGTDNVISCGSYVGNGGVLNINLGYEPQWLLLKQASGTGGNWSLIDNMRGAPVLPAYGNYLAPNTPDAEVNGLGVHFNATGFNVDGFGLDGSSGQTYIYIAIRRGPMRTPTTGTSVFTPVYSSAVAGTVQTTNFPVDAQILRYPQEGFSNFFVDRLRGVSTTPANQASPYLVTNSTNAETTGPNLTYGWNNTGFSTSSSFNNLLTIFWNFRRAPGFFDEVCYTGTGVANRVLNHNLGVPPELMIFKSRNSVTEPDWLVQCTPGPAGRFYFLNTDGFNNTAFPNVTNITSTTVTLDDNTTNDGAGNYVAYFFASCPGVSKVGAFTGTGATQVIDCGFTTGARFVLIKSTNALGDWYVWDSARGIVAGNDPYLRLNTTTAEVTGTDWVDTAATGFELSNAGGNLANSNGVTYIFFAVA